LYIFLACILGTAFIGYMLFNNRNMKSYNHYMKRKRKLEQSIDITPTQIYSNQNVVLAINDEEKKLCVNTMKSGKPVPLVYDYNDITSCEIVEYGVNDPAAAVNRKVRRQSVASVLGDSMDKVFPDGSDQQEEEKISRIDLKISFNDTQNPYVLANFLFWEVGKDSEEYKTTSEAALKWNGIINEIIKKRRAEIRFN